jgi:hypothetical protein
MRVALAICIAALAIAGCSHENEQSAASEPRTPTHAGVTNAQPAPRSSVERARELVLAAGLQIQDLRDVRAQADTADKKRAIDREIVALSRWRDQVLIDLTVPSGKPDPARLDADSSNLQRQMRAASATQPQAPLVRPIRQPEVPPGGNEAYPPSR